MEKITLCRAVCQICPFCSLGQKMGMKIDHIMMKDGKMQVMKNNKPMTMYKDMILGNGTEVMTNGMVKMKNNGMSMTMKDGDMIYMDGKMSKMVNIGKMGKMEM